MSTEHDLHGPNRTPNARSPAASVSRNTLLAAIIAGLWAFAAVSSHAEVVSVFFVQDDFWFLNASANPSLRTAILGVLPGYVRPIPTFWFTLMNRVLWGLDHEGYRISQLIVLATTVACLFLVLLQLSRSNLAASAGTAVFTFSKVHLYTLGWFAGSIDLVAGVFYVAGIWAYLTFLRTRSGQTMLLAFIVLGLLSKESVVALPVGIVLHQLMLVLSDGGSGNRFSRSLAYKVSGVLIGYLALWAILARGRSTGSVESILTFQPQRALQVLQAAVISIIPGDMYMLPPHPSPLVMLFPAMVIAALVWRVRQDFELGLKVGFGFILFIMPSLLFAFSRRPVGLQMYYGHFNLYGLSILLALLVAEVSQRTFPDRRAASGLLMTSLVVYSVAAATVSVHGIRQRRSPALFEATYSSRVYEFVRPLVEHGDYERVVFLDAADITWWATGKGVMFPVMFNGLEADFDGKEGYAAPGNLRSTTSMLVIRQTGDLVLEVVD